ncbi:hypothetical protein BYT27DRAFT_7228246 [Phlegmacium glaucopus]|nr:hypothetical protein BYT27DRAFT_7228246 [Phlegmacium glaucopus]
MDAPSSAMDISPDPVSLRAAALSTLKLKRRKPVLEKATTMVASRPTLASDFQLDYGQEDVMVVDPSPPPPPPPRKSSPKSIQKGPIITKDAQMREEGEISDEEILPSAVPVVRPPPPQPPLRKSKSPVPTKILSPEPVKVVEVKSNSPLQKSLTPEERAPLSLLERFSRYELSNQESENDIVMPDVNEPDLDTTLPLLGPDRVRPGLLLTMDEYDTAKDIILDLLGWGVPPDFLVDCGLTKELVFYVFTELNLRLPDNFDSSDIIPYTPESFTRLQQYVLMPPPPLPENNRTTIDVTTEVIPRVTPPPLPSPTILSSDNPSNTDLHDMERQRRQELLARKAVQASRRLKQSASIETPPNISQSDSSSTDKQDVSMAAVISTEVIEDFLNSIGPVRDTEHLDGILPLLSDKDQGMDDAQIITVPRLPPASPAFSSANTDDIDPSPPSTAYSHGPLSSSAEPPPTSVDSLASAASNFFQLSEANLTIDSGSRLSPPREPNTHPRRGMRPVASDFVDFDPTPRGNESKSRLEPPAFSSGIIRRLNLAANFRDIGSRRCVIDLSDSEDDVEQEVKERLQQSQLIVEDQAWLKRDRRSKASNYHPPASIKSSLSGNQSPAALMLKELEIRRMRELIAKREEETRLKKLASAKSSVNIDTSGSSTPIYHLPALKQEDVDVIMNPDSGERNGFTSYRNSESATPPRKPCLFINPFLDLIISASSVC